MLQVAFVITLLYLSGNWPIVQWERYVGKWKLKVDFAKPIGYICMIYTFWQVSGLFVTKFFQGQ